MIKSILIFSRIRSWAVMLLLSGATLRAANAAEREMNALVRVAHQTLEQIEKAEVVRWRVKCETAPGESTVISVAFSEEARREIYFYEKNGKLTPVMEILEREGYWWIKSGDTWQKTRPYEAVLPMPGAYSFKILAADVRCVTAELLTSARYRSREGDVLTYSVPVSGSQRSELEESLQRLRQFKETRRRLTADAEQRIVRMEKLLAGGAAIRIDAKTGLIVERSGGEKVTIKVDAFSTSGATQAYTFAAPTGAYEDISARWKDPQQGILMTYDPTYSPSVGPLSLDGFLLHARTGELRRIPYQGEMMSIVCFLRDRRSVLICGISEGVGELMEVDLETGLNTPVPSPDVGGLRIPMDGAVSPDGREVAVLYGPDKLWVFNLETREWSAWGTPGRLGHPLAWLADGKGLILKRYESKADEGTREGKMVCRLDRDGKLTDLIPGDVPYLLPKSKRILFLKDDEWQICDLDGKNAKRYADGMRRYASPAVSPDEKQIVFMEMSHPSGFPKPEIFDFGRPKGRALMPAVPGLFTATKWR